MIKVNDSGTVFWVTGLSGAGKTTLASKLAQYLKENGKSVVFLDGDELREVFGDIHAHTRSERLALAKRYSRLCKMLSDQNKDVVCATISMFHEVQDWNRANIENYIEIFIDVPIEILVKRDQKRLYSHALAGKIENVMGVDVVAEFPVRPDLTIVNDGAQGIDEIFLTLITGLESQDEY
ncbi:MAG: adenylyl-sulfate kinase [Gammaproteobacteria bacterium]|nr:adenylyl-sulfate kinase [Gammaproteobacteria bacterium]